MRDGMHDWVEANHRMAKEPKAKGYEYQYLFCRGARRQRRQRPAAVPPARHRVGMEGDIFPARTSSHRTTGMKALASDQYSQPHHPDHQFHYPGGPVAEQVE